MPALRQIALFRHWPGVCFPDDMLHHARRLFTIKTKFEAYLIIYGLATGAAERGVHYMRLYPGAIGWVFFALCPVAVFMAGATILESFDIPE
jgi:hypothetical protein